MNGLTVMGGILPALGFATTIFTIGKNKFLPMFIIGFLWFNILKYQLLQLQYLVFV